MNGKSDNMSSTRTSGKKIVLSVLVVSMFLLASFAVLMPTSSASNEGKTVGTLRIAPTGVTSHEGWGDDDYEYAIGSSKCTLTLKGGVYDCSESVGICVDGEWGEKVLDILLKGDVTINCSQPFTYGYVNACIYAKNGTTVNINGDATLTLNNLEPYIMCYSLLGDIIHIGSDDSRPRVITQKNMEIHGLFIDHGVVVFDLEGGGLAIICGEKGITLGSADSALCVSSEGGIPFISAGEDKIDLSKGFLYLESKTGTPFEIPSKTGAVKKTSTDGVKWDDYSSGKAKYFKSSPATAEFYFGNARGGSASFAIDYKDCDTILVGQPVKIQAFPHTDEDEFSTWTDGSTENPRWVVADKVNLYTPVFKDDSGNHVWVCFHVDGDLYQMEYVKKNTPVSEPMEPTAEGKVFLGWYTADDVKWDFNNSVGESDLDLYAKFEGQVIVDATETGEVEIQVGANTTSITVIFADKANLYIEDITVLRGKTISVSLQPIEDNPGMYDLDVEDTTTNEDVEVPMKVTLPYDDDKSGPVVYYYPDDGSDKVDMHATVNHDWTVTFTTTHNSVYGIEYTAEPEPVTPTSSDNGNIPLLIVVVLVILAIAAIGVKRE